MTCINRKTHNWQIDYVNKQQSSDRGEHDLSLDRWNRWMVAPTHPLGEVQLASAVQTQDRVEVPRRPQQFN